VWHLPGHGADGTLSQFPRTGEAKGPQAGAGKPLAERELVVMVAKVASSNAGTGSETVEEVLNARLDHIGPNRSPSPSEGTGTWQELHELQGRTPEIEGPLTRPTTGQLGDLPIR